MEIELDITGKIQIPEGAEDLFKELHEQPGSINELVEVVDYGEPLKRELVWRIDDERSTSNNT